MDRANTRTRRRSVLPVGFASSWIRRIRWFRSRFGTKEIFLKPLRVLVSPLLIPLLPRRTILFAGRTLPCFDHPHNATWSGERCLEMAIAKHLLELADPETTLEVGNVLAHYLAVRHEVIDKYEKGARNLDIVDLSTSRRYDLILSISTFEHIGFDEPYAGPSEEKILAAVETCQRHLSRSGRLVLTLPLGYNPGLDRILADGSFKADVEHYFERTGYLTWKHSSKERALARSFGRPWPYANALLVAEFHRKEESLDLARSEPTARSSTGVGPHGRP